MSLVDYSDMEKEIAEIPDPHTLPAGSEVKARIIYVNSGEGEYGKWYRLTFDVPSDSLVYEFGDFFSDLIDAKKGDVKNYEKAVRKFRSFAKSFGIDFSKPFSWEDDLIGKEGWVILGLKKSEQFGEQNTVSKYVAGR